MKIKKNVINLDCPVLMLPEDDCSTQVPVLMERNFMDKVFKCAVAAHCKIEKHVFSENNVKLFFKNNKHAILFALMWKDNNLY